jgi:N4-gp56 family major capsid protein
MPTGPAYGGDDVATVGSMPDPGGLAVDAGTQGAVFTTLDAAWSQIVTNLVIKTVIKNLRKDAVFAQPGNGALRAIHIPGTNLFVYTAFGDLPPAVDLLEGVPPQTIDMSWGTDSFAGKQKGNVVAITDLATVFSPYDLYSQASEKLAWNAVEAVEDSILAAIVANALAIPALSGGYSKSIIDLQTKMKRLEIPTFSDGTYHAFVTPETAALLMKETGELGWTDVSKYAQPENILNGEVGKYRGFRFLETTRMAAVADASPQVVYAFGPEAWAQGDYQTIRPYRVTGPDHADPLEQRALFGWKGMWGHKAIKMASAISGAPSGNTFLQKVVSTTIAA